MPERLIPGVPGLQPERTDLSWSRTALTLMVNGGLLLVRHDLRAPGMVQFAGSALAFLLALFTIEVSRHRRLALNQRPLPARLADPLAILLLGGGTAALGGIVVGVMWAP
jgi:Domain of unknown function (DUF202)